MNYIELINNFWELDERWQFTCCETRLYFYLVKTANRLGWVDNWTHSDAKASANVGVSENSLKTARNKLIQSGLIDFKAGGKFRGDKNRYQILIPNQTPKQTPYLDPYRPPKPTPLYKLKPNKTIIPPNPQGGTVDIENSEVEVFEDMGLDAETPETPATKTTDAVIPGHEDSAPPPPPPDDQKPPPKPPRLKTEIDLSFVANDFKPIVEYWLKYKSSRGQTYKNVDSLQKMYQKLLKCSKDSPETAKRIIDESVANNWAGFFELKNQASNDQRRISSEALPTGTEGYTGTI